MLIVMTARVVMMFTATKSFLFIVTYPFACFSYLIVVLEWNITTIVRVCICFVKYFYAMGRGRMNANAVGENPKDAGFDRIESPA